MAKVSTNIALDPQLKVSAQNLFSDLGMDLTTAVTIFLRQAVREQRIPFEIKRPIQNEETLSAMNEYYAIKNNPEQYKRYSSFSELRHEVLDNA